MKKKTIIKVTLMSVFAVTSFIPLHAGSWNWTRPYKMPEKNVNTLIIVGNYRKPRLLADLIQSETKQPILLIPSDTDGQIYFMPAKDETMSIELTDLTDFLKYLKPGKIIVLGDKRYVPENFLKAIDPSQTVISVTNKSWDKIAKTTARIMDLTYLDRRFNKYEAKIESGELYSPENPALGDNALIKENDSVVLIDETKIEDTVIVDDSVVEKTEDSKVLGKDVTTEPKLIDEGKVVPQK